MAVFYTYGALVFFLVCGSCSSLREERAARAAWGDLSEDDRKTYKYLALVKCGAGECSGSIISETMVITYCPHAKKDCDVYAGSSSFSVSRTKNKVANMQVLQVQSVIEYSDDLHLKICVMNDTWKFGDFVGDVTLHLNGNRGKSQKTCKVLGFKKGTTANAFVAQMMDQDIGNSALCSITQSSPALWYSAPKAGETLGPLDFGGPVVCDNEKQWGISMEFKPKDDQAKPATPDCNLFINVAKYSKWIEEQKNAADSGAPGGTGGNSTSPSSGYSIHSYLNKYSSWKVLLLCLIIIKFLVY